MKRGFSTGRLVGTKGAGASLLALTALLPAAAQTIDLGAGGVSASSTGAGAAVGGSGLQLPGAARSLRLTARLGVTETVTDNALLSPTDRRVEAITQPSAGVSLRSTGGRVRGFLDYTLTGLLYARGTSGNTLQNALNASLTGELVEKRVFVDVAGTISQQSISALGTQSVDPALASSNRTEVRTLRVSPFVQGLVPGIANYEARVARTVTRTTSSLVSNVTTTLASVQATGLRAGWVNWSANASHQTYSYSAGRDNESDRANGLLILTVDPQLRFTLNAGYESSNFSTLDKQGRVTYGLRSDWTPSVRTSVAADFQRRVFGNAYTVSAAYRTPRSAWLYSDVRDVSATGLTAAVGAQTTQFDLFYSVLASTYPDPVLRRARVNELLLSLGIDPAAPVVSVASGYLASAATVRRLQQLSFTLLGLRDTLTLLATRSDAQRIDTMAASSSDFATFGRLRQQGLSANLSHRLAPQSSVSFVYSQQRNEGSEASSSGPQATVLRSAIATLSTAVNMRTRASLSARHTRFTSNASPYHESAVIANVSLQF